METLKLDLEAKEELEELISEVPLHTSEIKVAVNPGGGGGFSDLDWSGMCRWQLGTHTNVQG